MNKVQAVVLAAGESRRFYPFNGFSHKTLVAVLGKPIIVHTIESIKRSGITDIIIVTSPNGEIKSILGNGERFGVSIRYVVQDKPEGMGDALLLCRERIKSDFFLMHASHLDFDTFAEDLLKAKKEDIKGVLLAKRKKLGQNQGILKLSGRKVEEIIEKPKKVEDPSSMHVVGIYLLNKDFLNTLEKSSKEHYRLEKAISDYAKENHIGFLETKKDTISLKYPWDLLAVKDYLFKNIKRQISPNARIAKNAEIIGEAVVGDGVEIMEGARIKGPCFIGKNVTVGNNALLRNGVDVEEHSVVGGYMEMKNTILMRNSTTHSGFIGDSIIGPNCKIAAQFCTGNLRLDRNLVKSNVGQDETDTGLKYLGVIVGEDTNIGIKVSTMPGVIIGRHSVIGPSTVVMKNVSDNTRYYTKFAEIVSKNEK
ncbi:MAG: NTP transferase domain-containing protein [Candidatus Levybacteria bacterium]|nr:NTP transferase domain-containing protein [Candidatus Levybacteria bacterium]